MYTPRAREIVAAAYARELEQHGYAFDPEGEGGQERGDILPV
jgi:hypothetical protein